MKRALTFRGLRREDSKASSSAPASQLAPTSTWASGLIAHPRTSTNSSENSKGLLGLNLLLSPSEPLVDLVFVHGLGGGPRKTWSKTPNIDQFWPQEWLGRDPAFGNVRVHSFGYNSDWSKNDDNCLNVHHFGKSLLGEISTSPLLANTDTAIIFIGHSMGGLVIKKAYTLARQDAAYERLAERFRTIFFLATPHRGSDSAKLLSSILQVTASSRAYVTDLQRSSLALQTINDGFRHYSGDVELWSFYETQSLSIGGISKMIVEPESAMLGYREEISMPMNADHRSICKFDSETDPNYIIIRNSLAAVIERRSTTVLVSKGKCSRAQIKDLGRYLNVSENLQDDLINLEDARMAGTCEWFMKKESFRNWKEFNPKTPRLLWIKGKPAAGKSVLAGYVIDKLRASNANYTYFFFKHGNKTKSRLSSCLRSIAYQIAGTSSRTRERLLEMQEEDVRFDQENEGTVWRKLFLSLIFETDLAPQHWVIDGLDECDDSSALFETMLPKLDQSTPVRILITSRETSELELSFESLGNDGFHTESVSAADTLPDIKILVEAKARSLNVKNDEDRSALAEKIVAKSNGSFLWTVLVLNELSRAYSEKEITHVLEEVPRGMEQLYHRTLENMSQASGAHGKNLARTILIWATCSTRPLNIQELEGALKLAVNDSFPNLGNTVLALCGQLVTVDKTGRVLMVHDTAREFLLGGSSESEFSIDKTVAHTEIARICLLYLTGDEMKAPRRGRGSLTSIGKKEPAAFSQYVFTSFAYHLAKADPRAHDLFLLVVKFLSSNVLVWIEVVAKAQHLTPLILTARSLRRYLQSCSTERPAMCREMQDIKGWATDLTRIAAKFADALITSPSAIYGLIPPFCPKGSTVHKVGNSLKSLSVLGLSNTEWDDRLSCIDFRHSQATALCYGDSLFAIGLANGTISLYDATSCQEYKVLDHGEAVKLLIFKEKSELMVSCGLKTINVWDVQRGDIIHKFQSPPRPVSLTFGANNLMVASHKNYFAVWDLKNDGMQLPNVPWTDYVDGQETPLRYPPRVMSISVGHKMMAVAYPNQPVKIWDLEDFQYVGTCGKKLENGETTIYVVSDLVFNPNVNIELLAIAYFDGELVLVDPFTDRELKSVHANCYTYASSPDGRLLAAGGGGGVVQIYEFDTLNLLYRVQASNFFISRIAFSNDNLHFADIRGSQCNVWEPAVILRDLVGDETSENEPAVFEAVTPDTKSRISAMALHPAGEVSFCGKEDGSVFTYDTKTGAQLSLLYRHKSLVRILCWWPDENIITSVDASNGIFAWKLKKTVRGNWEPGEMLFQSRLDCGKSIVQVLLSQVHGKLVLSTRESDHLWSIDGEEKATRNCAESPGIRKWIRHHKSLHHLICIDGSKARIFLWDDLSEVACVPLDVEVTTLQIKSASFFGTRQRLLLEFSERDGSAATQAIYLFDAAVLDIKSDTVQEGQSGEAMEASQPPVTIDGPQEGLAAASYPILPVQSSALAHHAAHIISLSPTGRLIFLDTHSWVCSLDLETLSPKSLPINTLSTLRHFFVPYDWFSGTREVICAVSSSRRDVIFARNDEVAVVRDGLQFMERVELGIGEVSRKNTIRRPSLRPS